MTASFSRHLRISLTALNAYPLFDPAAGVCFGGAETHAWLLARGLSRREDFDVNFVVRAPRLFRRRIFDRITVWNAGDGLSAVRHDVAQSVDVLPQVPWLKVRQFRPRLLWQVPLLAMARAFQPRRPGPTQAQPLYARIGADLFCCFGVSGDSAGVVASASQALRPSLLFLESNSDLNEQYQPGSTYVSPNGERGDVCHYALRNASAIVAQHAEQQRRLQERFGRESDVLPNVVDLSEWDRGAAAPSPTIERLGLNHYVLWVGRADDFHKRPQLCLELARRLPDIPFLMVLNPRDERVERAIQAQRGENVTIVESVPFSEMPAVLSRAAVFVSTGSPFYEGSPNIFLQAAASGVPVASLDVSMPLLEEAGAGYSAGGDVQRLADYLRDVTSHPDRARAQGEAGRRFVEERHTVPIVVDRLARLLQELAARSRETTAPS